MFKNVYVRLSIISLAFVLSILTVLPNIPITIKNKYVNIDSSIGGYYFSFFGGRWVLDLRNFKEGLDIQGGIRVVLQTDMSKIEEQDKNSALESASEVISRRVNLLGVSEPNITTSNVGDQYRIIVEIPGIDDIGSAVSLIGQTAQLNFKQLAPENPWEEARIQEYYMNPSAWVSTNVTGADLKGADVVFAQQGNAADAGSPQIQLRFTNEGRQKFSDLAKANINKPIGLFLDESQSPISMPIVSPDLADGLTTDPVINGSFDIQTANALSVQIRAGALPVPVEVIEQKTVGATLGSESIQKSFVAGAVGLVLVLLFMIFMYGGLGVLSSLALVLYGLMVLAIFKAVPVVLTLPGIAGFILSVGMATDANILVFERIKEEVRWGRPRNLAIRLGFERAWDSIKDSNISSLLTCAVLFYLGTGPVRGFALTLAIGIFVSLFSSIFVVRTLIEVLDVNVKTGFKKGAKNADN